MEESSAILFHIVELFDVLCEVDTQFVICGRPGPVLGLVQATGFPGSGIQQVMLKTCIIFCNRYISVKLIISPRYLGTFNFYYKLFLII